MASSRICKSWHYIHPHQYVNITCNDGDNQCTSVYFSWKEDTMIRWTYNTTQGEHMHESRSRSDWKVAQWISIPSLCNWTRSILVSGIASTNLMVNHSIRFYISGLYWWQKFFIAIESSPRCQTLSLPFIHLFLGFLESTLHIVKWGDMKHIRCFLQLALFRLYQLFQVVFYLPIFSRPWCDDVIKRKHFPLFTGDRGIPLTKASDADDLMLSLICVWIYGWVNSREAGDLRPHRAQYDVTVMRKRSNPGRHS